VNILHDIFNKVKPDSRGAWFDFIYFTISITISSLIPVTLLIDNKHVAGVLLIVFLLFQAIGALLKRHPLHSRSTRLPEPVNYWLFYLLQWALYIIFIGLIMHLMNWHKFKGYEVGAFVTGSSIALFIILACIPPKTPKPYSRTQEFIADALILVSAVILTQIFWNSLADELSSGSTRIARDLRRNPVAIVLYFFVFILPFLLMYILPRFLLFFEDAKNKKTWIRFSSIYIAFWLQIILALA